MSGYNQVTQVRGGKDGKESQGGPKSQPMGHIFKQDPGHRGRHKNTSNSFPWRIYQGWGEVRCDSSHPQCQRKEAGFVSYSFQLLFNFLRVFVLFAVYPA